MDFGTMMNNLRRGCLFTHNPQVDSCETYEAHILKANMPKVKEEDVKVQVDWRETYEAHILKADIPGVKEDDVKVQVSDIRMLEITGERKKEELKEGDTWLFIERPSGNFSRRFEIPYGAVWNGAKLHAHVKDGVLTVEIPKTYSSKPTVTPIDFS